MAKDDDDKLKALVPTRGGEENDEADDDGDEEDDEDAPRGGKKKAAANGKDDDDDSSAGDLVDYTLTAEQAKALGVEVEEEKPAPKKGDDGEKPARADEEHPDDEPNQRRLSKGARDRARRREAEAEARRLRDEVAELKRTVGTHSQRLSEQQLADLDRGIGDVDGKIAAAKRKRAEAREAQDWNASDTANDELRALERERERMEERREAAKKQPAPKAETESDAPRVDRRVVDQFNIWHGRNPGFDREMRDPQSRAVAALERQLSDERQDHDTPGYWRELDKRIKEAGISLAMDEDQDAGGGQRATRDRPDPARTARPSTVGSGNGSVPRPKEPKVRIPRQMSEYLENADLSDEARDDILKKYIAGVKKGGRYAQAS